MYYALHTYLNFLAVYMLLYIYHTVKTMLGGAEYNPPLPNEADKEGGLNYVNDT